MKTEKMFLFLMLLLFLSFSEFTTLSFAAEWTFLVYLDGDNNLEGAGVDDINEMEKIGSTPEVNIVVQFDRIAGYDTSNGDWSDTRRGLIVQDVTSEIVSPLGSIGEKNMGDPDTLREFVIWGMTNFPAHHYLLVLWNHGDGWLVRLNQLHQALSVVNAKILKEGLTYQLQSESLELSKKIYEATKSICIDNTSGGDALTIKECREALEGIQPKIDIIGFDACLMGMIEVAYEIKDVGNIMVGSQNLEPDDGWPYDLILSQLISTPSLSPVQLAKTIVSFYGESYGGEETQSAILLSNITNLANKIDTLATTLLSETTDWEIIERARSSTTSFYEPDYRDLRGFLNGLIEGVASENVKNAAIQTRLALSGAIIQNDSGTDNGAYGLSIHLIGLGGHFPLAYNDSNLSFASETHWDEFLQELTRHEVPDDRFEENDSFNEAPSLNMGEYQSLRLKDDDWFKVVFPPHTPIIATISFSNRTGDLDFELYDQDRNLLDSSESLSDTESVYFKSETQKEYFIHVYGFKGATNIYDLFITTPPPDNHYTYEEIPFAWIEATDGTFLAMGDDDYTSVEIGFNFKFYGINYSGIKISSNGYLTFGYVGDEYYNQPIPIGEEPSNFIAPFWDDLTPSAGNGVYYKIIGNAPNRNLVIQWNKVPHYETTKGITFEVILHESSNEITFQYQDVSFDNPNFDHGQSATVGIENSSGSKGTLFSYKNASLYDGLALRFYPLNSNFFNLQKIETTMTSAPLVGNPVAITCKAKGEMSPLYYRFWIATGFQTEGFGNWQIIKDWSTDNTLTWIPDRDDHYVVVAWVSEDPNQSNFQQTGLSIETAGNRVHPILITGLTTNLNYPQERGKAIALDTYAVGGTGPLFYRYCYSKGIEGDWKEIRRYSLSRRCIWTPPEEGQYIIHIWVTDNPFGNYYSLAGITFTVGE